MDQLAGEHELRYILGLAEVVVMAMADGYAQASGQLAACNLHVAPGLGNAMGMLYDAKKAGAPILVTAGQHDQGFALKEPLLWGDLPEIARPFVKWSAEVRSIHDLPQMIHRAAKTALAHPTGASVPVAAWGHHERRGGYRFGQANADRRWPARRHGGDCGGGGADGEGGRGPSSLRAMRWRRATRMQSLPRWRRRWARRSMTRRCRAGSIFHLRIRCMPGR